MEGWVNTETLVGSLQTEAGNKSKDEIKSFLADFGVEDDIGTISSISMEFLATKSSEIPKYSVLLSKIFEILSRIYDLVRATSSSRHCSHLSAVINQSRSRNQV